MSARSQHSPRPQVERRNQTRDRLLEAAAQLIARGGLAALTVAGVGSLAGYSRGIANHHFGSKAALVNELVDQVEGEFATATTPAAQAGSSIEALVEMSRIFVHTLNDLPVNHRAFLVLWAGAATGEPEIRARMNRSDERFRSVIDHAIRRGIDVGDVRADVDPATIATWVIAQLRGVAIQHLLAPSAVDLPAVGSVIEKAIRAELTAPRSAGGAADTDLDRDRGR